MQHNLNVDPLTFIKRNFLRILNYSQSFQEQLVTFSSCKYTVSEKKKTLNTAIPEFISTFIFAQPISFGAQQGKHDIIILHMHTINENHDLWFLRQEAWQTKFFCHFGPFFALPFTPLTTQKI